jgi:hypothetical protein
MSKPTLSDLPRRYQEQVAAQLYATPRPRTIAVERDEPKPAKRIKKDTPDATAYFTAAGLPAPTREFRFHPERRFRFDYAWEAEKIALEVEGAVWTGGRHTSGAGFMRDMEKYNLATVCGWRVLRCTPSTLRTAATVFHLRLALALATP